MPVIGDRSRFAVEYELSDRPGGVWMHGHCRYWRASRELGKQQSTSALVESIEADQGLSRLRVRSHCSTSDGHWPMGRLIGRSPKACPPCAYKCSSAGTRAFFSAM
jgi:hypothetical protein